MSSKRYQVFVSSTFLDLEDIRQDIIKTLIQINCIPAGMELFPAADDEQFAFIRTVIDQCDYYIVIVGARYGSVSEKGISYTEMEYDYALEKRIPVLAFIHSCPDDIPVRKSEIEAGAREKLQMFREKLQRGRLVKPWKDPSQLQSNVILALMNAFTMFPAIGWIRGDAAASTEVLSQVNKLRLENDYLKTELETYLSPTLPSLDDLADIEETVTVKVSFIDKSGRASIRDLETTWRKILSLIGPDLFVELTENNVGRNLGKYLVSERDYRYADVEDQSMHTIRLQFIALGYIKVTEGKNYGELLWNITNAGKNKLFELRTIKKHNQHLQ